MRSGGSWFDPGDFKQNAEYNSNPDQVWTIPPKYVTARNTKLFNKAKIIAIQKCLNWRNDLFIDTKLSSETPYVGQRIVYTWKFYRSVRLADANVDLPDFEGFIVEELGEQREFNTTLNGKNYVVTELLRALTPQEAGTITLPGSALNADVVVSRSGRRR